MLRKKSADGASAPAPAIPDAAAPEAVVPTVEAPASVAASAAPPAAKPKGTSDIMAAIRAKGAAAASATPAPAAAASSPVAAAPAAAGAKPKGTSDIMAAIRAKGTAAAAGATAPGAAAPVAAVAAAVATPQAVGAGKSPAEMIKAMRASAAQAGAPASEAPAIAAPAKPKLPPKSASPVSKKPEIVRRALPAAIFAALCVPYYMGWTLLSVIGGLWGLGMARFMMPNTVLELPSKFKVGSLGDYPLGTVSEKYKASRGVWIVHTDSYDGQNVLYALSSVCTHLGCTPSWLDAEQKFKCPCHGSGFYISGVNFEGPAPRPLERIGLVLGADGTLEVDKSVKFQEELGQWADTKSFVKIS